MVGGLAGFQDQMFTTADGDDARRSWHARVRRPDPNRRPGIEERFGAFRRPADTVQGRSRTPGVDLLSRAGTVTASPLAGPDR